MTNFFKFSDWNQICGLRSKEYSNLQLWVTQYKDEKNLVGTQISIMDTDNEINYFTGFVRVVKSTRFDSLAVFEVDDMVKRINSYGFNISIIEPISLPPNVITMLKGLNVLGYNYITLEYIRTTSTENKSLYQSDIDDKEVKLWDEHYLPPPYKAFSNKYIVATKNLGDVPNRHTLHFNQPLKNDIYVVSEAPEFSWEDFKWVRPAKVYSIELLINPKNGSDSIISDAEVPSTSNDNSGTETNDESGD